MAIFIQWNTIQQLKKTIDKSNNVDESQKHHAQQKKPNTKEHL